MIKVYRKTGTIKAEQFDGSDEMAKKYSITPPMPLDPDYTINTLEGDMVLGVGDWVATGINGENWPIADDVFKKTYAELPVIPENVDYSIKKYKEWNYDLGIVFDNACSGHAWEDDVGEWILENSNVFARAWLDGYVVEVEK
ncbi:DUF1642 domain-containing protein [Lactiplantibacillus plantarum]|uniref:DUF1642 domain-containing protein n=1 Tax=Lactiplantibacillus plantarum TaxID=1590 RepID=UPI0013302F5E|nr:DUF1642 domain-containing protein [Lactiplantibacillus plantarum]